MGDFITIRTDPLPRSWNDFARDVRQLVSFHFGAEGTGWWLVDVTILAPEGGRQMAVVNISQVGDIWDAHRFVIEVTGLEDLLIPPDARYPLVLRPFYFSDPSSETFLINAYTRQYAPYHLWQDRPVLLPMPRPGPWPHHGRYPGPGPHHGPHPGPRPPRPPRRP
jgi:hypothetical protein